MQKPAASRPKPAARPLPGQNATAAAAPITTSRPTPAPAPALRPTPAAVPAKNGVGRAPPAPHRNVAPPPPPPPPPAPAKPEVPLYRAKFAFDGQAGEMTLKKDDLVELVEKDDNGWWLVKKDGTEGWAPHNYLELEPPKAAAPAPPPPPRARAPPPAPAPAAAKTPTSSNIRTSVASLTADMNAKPVAVFPGMAAGNGSATPWKKTASTDSSTSSRPSSSLASKPPPVAAKPKPAPPPVGAKPGAPKVPGKPPVPSAPRPTPAAPPRPGGAVKPPSAPAGQMDLAALVRTFFFYRSRLADCSPSWPNVQDSRGHYNTPFVIVQSMDGGILEF